MIKVIEDVGSANSQSPSNPTQKKKHKFIPDKIHSGYRIKPLHTMLTEVEPSSNKHGSALLPSLFPSLFLPFFLSVTLNTLSSDLR